MKKDNTPPRITHPVPAETLAAYHEGRLSPEEEHALEMAALDDPFLADALEGIDMLSPEELQADLVALGSRMEGLIAEEENDVKVIAMVPWWRRPLSIAAVVALLISAISLAILLPANQDTELAVATEALENETRALEVKEEPTGDSPEGTAVPKQLDKTDLSTTIATNEQSTNQIRARERADSEVQPSAPVEKSEEVFLTEIAMVEAEPAPELPAEPEFGEAVTEEALVEDLVFESNLDEAFAESEAMDLAEEELDPLATGAGGQVNRGMALADSSILEETESYSYAEAEPEAERDAVPEMADQPARSTTRNSGRLFSGRRKQQAEEATEAAPPAILQEEARYGNAFADDDDVDQGLVSSAPTGVRTLTGSVVDEEGNTLPGVNLVVTGLNRGAVTDLDGNYLILVPFEAPTITVSYIGYKPQVIDINNKDQLDIALEPDVAVLSEVVVEGERLYRYNQAISEAQIYGPIPIGGFAAYMDYLVAGVELPENTTGPSYVGNVELRFVVDEDGVTRDFEILQRVGYGVENQIINLIRNGPLWEPSRSQGWPVATTMKLEIPIYR